MKSISVADAQVNLEAVLKSDQGERVVLMREGKPSAILMGIEGYDEEDLQLATSAPFWEMIEARRKGPSIPLAEFRARLNGRTPKKKPKQEREQRRKRGGPSP